MSYNYQGLGPRERNHIAKQVIKNNTLHPEQTPKIRIDKSKLRLASGYSYGEDIDTLIEKLLKKSEDLPFERRIHIERRVAEARAIPPAFGKPTGMTIYHLTEAINLYADARDAQQTSTK